jgi:hypothetical protein
MIRASGVYPVVRRVLVCGDRHWKDDRLIHGALAALKERHGRFVVIEGGANGADTLAWHVATDELLLDVETFPADWTKYKRAAGPLRNRQMLDTKPDLVLAFHDNIERSRGTKDCVEEARRRGIPVRVVSHTSEASAP